MSVFRPTKNTKQNFFFSVCYILSRRTVSIQQKSSSSSSWKMHSIISNTAHTRTRERTSRSRVTRSLGKVTTRFSWMNFSTRRRCKKKCFRKEIKVDWKIVHPDIKWFWNEIIILFDLLALTTNTDELYLKHWENFSGVFQWVSKRKIFNQNSRKHFKWKFYLWGF